MNKIAFSSLSIKEKTTSTINTKMKISSSKLNNWGNILLNTRWNHVFTPQLFSNTTLAYNRYVFDIRQEETSSIQQPDGSTIINGSNNLFHSGISDLSISTDFDYHRYRHTTSNLERNTYIISRSGSADRKSTQFRQ